jgi:serine/threonine protein kinase
MAIAPGTRFNHYEILSSIGAGGMGEVYRARDTRLDREVAIKVLTPDVAKATGRLLRFEQEARAASALNHPNILTVYDIGSHDGVPFMVSELLEGCELREQLNEGALPMRRALDYAQQITAGLAVAHEKGIIHRDLKPENLFVTKDGRVKILDFGLAKLKPQKLGRGVDSEAQTMKPLTNPGMVMGTAGYMSPEQVRGQEVDQRSDIFSFGLILYEMLAGERAFFGITVADLMSAILREEPPEISGLNEKIGPALDRIVRRCLEKKPEQRFHSAHDLGYALEVVASSNTSGSLQTDVLPVLPVTDSPKRGGWRDYLGWLVAGICALIAALSLWMFWFNRSQPTAQTVRFNILPPDKTNFCENSFAVSPDGRLLAFCAADANGKGQLFLRPLNSFASQPLPGTQDAALPFWSPDGRSLAFYSESKLKRIDISGGSVQTLCAAENAGGGTWNNAGDLIITPSGGELFRISANGGVPTPLTTLDKSRGELFHAFPQFLPDGQHFLYYASCRQARQSGIYVSSLTDKTARLVLSSDFNAHYASGHLLFVNDGTLMGQAFDTRTMKLGGEPFQIAEQVRTYFIIPLFSASQNGTLAYQSGGAKSPQLVWFDRNGKQLGTLGEAADYSNPSLAPDEKRIAVCIRDPQTKMRDIWLFDVTRGAKMRFTFDPADDLNPIWSKDGGRIYFSSSRKGPRDLYQKKVDAADEEEIIYSSSEIKNVEDISPDGRLLLYNTNDTAPDSPNKNDLWLLPLDGERIPKPYLKSQFNEDQAAISPDGRWVAYRSFESGREEIYVATFPQIGGKWQVSSGGGDEPRWRRDGKELYFTVKDRQLMAAEVKSNSSAFETGVPTLLFEIQLSALGRNRYVVSGDGQRFLVSTRLDETVVPINVVLNWIAEVKK